MFTDNLYKPTWENRSHRGWTTLASFAAQAMGVGLLLLLPMIYTQGLPQVKMLANSLSIPAPPPGPPPADPTYHENRGPISNYRDGILMTPDRIPIAVPRVDDRGIQPLDPGAVNNVLGAFGTGRADGILGSVLKDAARAAPPPKPEPVTHAPRVSRMMHGNLVYQVEPVYPTLARAAHIHGPVQLQAIISTQGTIESLRVISGHPMLVQAAVNAVQQWRYRPYELNGEPVEVETQVTVNFVLSGG